MKPNSPQAVKLLLLHLAVKLHLRISKGAIAWLTFPDVVLG